MASVIAAACFVGSFAAVGLAFLLENLRGENGARKWHERSRGLEQSVADLNGHMAAWNNDAAAVFAATGRSVGESKLARLIRRITDAVTVAFSSKSLPAASSREETPKSLRYLERCSVKFGKQGEQSIVESREDMTKHAVKRMQEECPEFLQKIRELWSEIARLSDPVAVGAFSVTKLRAALSNHLSTLPGTIDRLLCESTDPREAFIAIKEQAAKISSLGGHELLSVEVADGVRHDFRSHLLVSPEFLQGDEGDVHRLPQGAASVAPFLLIELAVIESGQLASPGKTMEAAT
jgi:hypothetical protein